MSGPARFVIVGGGTAGWITAFIVQDSLRRAKIDATVTVVEPSKIPTVGVGEATTAAILPNGLNAMFAGACVIS